MEYNTLKLEFQEVLSFIHLNRPKQLNAINNQMLDELDDALDTIEKNDDIRVIIITGNEKVFAAGADIKEIQSFQSQTDFLNTSTKGHEVLLRLENFDKPSIAMVNGIAFGGGFEIALACDFRVASTEARFGIPEIKLGLIPGWGGASRLQKVIPFTVFKEMLLTGEPISAHEAKDIGLVSYVVPNSEVLNTTLKLANTLANRPPQTVATAKKLANKQQNTDLMTAIELEKQTATILYEKKRDLKERVHL